MTQRKRPAAVSRARRRRNNRRRLILAAGIVLIILIIILIVVFTRKTPDTVTAAAPVATATPAPTQEATATPEPTAAPTATPAPDRAQCRPEPTNGLLPVFWSADTNEKIIAITVDDCFQAENLQQIVDKAIECGGKLTIFPIGENVLRERHGEVLRYAYENGFELENHTFTHNGLYGCTDEELAQEMYMQNLALSAILGVEYQAHFIRPKGGDARNDPRIHAYAHQLGYYGVAHWSVSGSGSGAAALASSLAPGAIYLFHTTDSDTEKLKTFIPYAVSQGYQLVTLNNLFDLPDNEISDLSTFDTTMPEPEPYVEEYLEMRKGDYSWSVVLIQQRLCELGFLDASDGVNGNAADGVFGSGTVEAVKKYQASAGLPVTGIADTETQKKLLG